MFSLKRRTYLDGAAATPVVAAARIAFTHALKSYGNPSASHAEGRAGRLLLEEARKTIARHAGAKSEGVIFTGNATEANALAIVGAVRAKEAKKMHLLYMAGAHASVANTMEALKGSGVDVEVIPLLDGSLDLEALRKLLRPETLLVSIEAISSETGMRAPARAVRQLLDEVAGKRILLHVDASQVPLVEPTDRTRFGADLMTLDASKVGGVRGIGALILGGGVTLAPLIRGGGQERGLRPGTETPALAQAFAAALEEASRTRDAFSLRAHSMRQELVKRIPGALINEGKEQAPHILNISLPGKDTDYLVALLDEAGFAVSTRSACETDSETGSRAVLALTGDPARAASTLRISFGPRTTAGEVKRFSSALTSAVAFLDRDGA